MNISYSPRALSDISAIADYIRLRNPKASVRVGDAIERTIRNLAINPKLGVDRPELGVRLLRVPRYPYSIYYRVAADQVVIIHIRDDRRRPVARAEL